MQIIPAILTADPEIVKERLQKFKSVFDWLQLDITDGVFVDNPTLSLKQFINFPRLKFFKLDIHLMVSNPVSFLEDCKKIKALRVTGQIEMMPSQKNFVQKAVDFKMKPGLAVDLPTSLDKLEKNLLSVLDTVLLMTAKAGFSGQKFQPSVLEKIKLLAKIKKERKLSFKIGLDCGINPDTIKKGYQAGAEIFYAASFLGKNPKQALKELKKPIYE